jgi:outer membrane cobalamin receptor
MPETHLLDIGITKNYYGIDLGLSISNVFDQDYERPHGFSQDGRKINFILKRRF